MKSRLATARLHRDTLAVRRRAGLDLAFLGVSYGRHDLAVGPLQRSFPPPSRSCRSGSSPASARTSGRSARITWSRDASSRVAAPDPSMFQVVFESFHVAALASSFWGCAHGFAGTNSASLQPVDLVVFPCWRSRPPRCTSVFVLLRVIVLVRGSPGVGPPCTHIRFDALPGPITTRPSASCSRGRAVAFARSTRRLLAARRAFMSSPLDSVMGSLCIPRLIASNWALASTRARTLALVGRLPNSSHPRPSRAGRHAYTIRPCAPAASCVGSTRNRLVHGPSLRHVTTPRSRRCRPPACRIQTITCNVSHSKQPGDSETRGGRTDRDGPA